MTFNEHDFKNWCNDLARGYARCEYFYNKLLVRASDDSQKFLDSCKEFQKVGQSVMPLSEWNRLVDNERTLIAHLEETDPDKLKESDFYLYKPNRDERRGNFVKRF